jgi:hypothetical protein
MKRPNKGGKRIVPQAGGEALHEGEAGPLIYTYPMPPVKSRGHLMPLVDRTESPTVDQAPANRPLVPASEEVARLPRAARDAFAARCAARVARLRPGATTPEAAAALLLAAATVETPIRRQLLCIRRDFDRLVYLAKKHDWTDDTPVPPDAFGPMWPGALAPDWAKEPAPAPPADPSAHTD